MKRFGQIFFVALVCGCQTYRYTYTPDITTGIKTGNKYRIQSVKVMTRNNFDGLGWVEADGIAASTWGFSAEDIKWLHSLNPDVYSEDGVPVTVRVKVDYDRISFGNPLLMLPYSLISMATLTIIPYAHHGDNGYTIEVASATKPDRSSSFEMHEEAKICNALSGLNLLFPYAPRDDERFSRCGSRTMMSTNSDADLARRECKFQAYSYAIAATLAKMESDGLIAVDGVSKLDPVVRERRKNLDSLLKSGVITEEEYKKEIGKETK